MKHNIFLALQILLWKMFLGRLQLAYWNVAEEHGTYQKNKLTINIFPCFQMSYTTKFYGILISIHLRSRASCWWCYINLIQTTWSAQERKTSPGTHDLIQAPKTDFRCHGHDLRSTKNSQTLFKTEFSNMTIDKFSKLSHSNPEIKLDLSSFYTRSTPGILGPKVWPSKSN